MTEPSEQDKYIKCKGCTCKYTNDDEHIKQYFVYNRLSEQLKTCVKCRNRNKHDKDKNKQQSVDTNVNKLCTRCCQFKPNLILVIINHVKGVNNNIKHKEDVADKQKHYRVLYRNKKCNKKLIRENNRYAQDV